MPDEKKPKRPPRPERARRIAAKGGRARAAALSPAERSAIARDAASARWSMPKATHVGTLEIGPLKIPCAVLDSGLRVLSQRGVQRVFGSGNPGRRADDDSDLPPFLGAKNLKPFVPDDLATTLKQPIVYRALGAHGGGNVAHGVDARLLADVCEVWLKARAAQALHYSQVHIAATAEVLVRGFARVGIVALIDEATGYQADRARDELNKILQAYIAEELRPWVRLFPNEFFKQIYRLQGWDYKPGVTQGPRYVGKLINKYIYDRLPQGVPERLRELNPPVNGQRRHKHFQLLTEHTGEPHLDRQITAVTTLMRVATDRHEFQALFARAFGKKGEQIPFRLQSGESADGDDDT